VRSCENILDVEGVFGSGGLLSRAFSGFEYRAEQVKMADAVRQGLARGGRLAVEAGTGVGKSFAYLVPAIERTGFMNGRSEQGTVL